MPKRSRRSRKRVQPVGVMDGTDAGCSPEKRAAVACDEAIRKKSESTPSLIEEEDKQKDLQRSAEDTEEDEKLEKDAKWNSESHGKPEKETGTCTNGSDSVSAIKSGLKVIESGKNSDVGSDREPSGSGRVEENVASAGLISPPVSGSAKSDNQPQKTDEANRHHDSSASESCAGLGLPEVSESAESDNQPEKPDEGNMEGISDKVSGDDGSGHKTEPITSEEESEKKSAEPSKPSPKVKRDFHSGESDENEWNTPWHRDVWQKERSKIKLPKLNKYSSFDTEQYRRHYPDKIDDPDSNHNLEFYQNERRCIPDGLLVDEIHEKWWGNYEHLEYCHTFIQWLFPIRERGMNFYAQELQLHEMKAICEDQQALDRLHKSYEMMLDFYGMKLKDRETGEVERSEHYKERFRNLNYSSHNYLRITRILKCLGEFGFEKYKSPFVRFCLKEAIVERTLHNTLYSALNYWAEVVRDDEERKELQDYAQKLADQENEKFDQYVPQGNALCCIK